jgi:hypothetical protein
VIKGCKILTTVFVLFLATFKMTAQIDKKWSGNFGMSMVYEPPFQKVYIPIGTDLIQFNPTLKLRINGEFASRDVVTQRLGDFG